MTLSPRKLEKTDSMEEFEFVDAEGDLNIDLTKSPAVDYTQKMGSGLSQLFLILSNITEEQGFMVSTPVRTIAATAIGAATGSMLGGPPGLAIGLVTGAIMAISISPRRSNNVKPTNKKSTIREIFRQMTLQQKKELLKELLSCLKQPNVRVLLYEIAKNETIRSTAINIVSNFLLKKLGLCLTK